MNVSGSMRNKFKFLMTVILLSLILFLVENIFQFYFFGTASALVWHEVLGIIVLLLIPIHIMLHFRRLKMLANEFFNGFRPDHHAVDFKDRISKYLAKMKLEDFAIYQGLSYATLGTILQEALNVTIHQDETFNELSTHLKEDVFEIYLKIVAYQLNIYH